MKLLPLLVALAACAPASPPDVPDDAGHSDAGDAGPDASCGEFQVNVSGSYDIDLHAVTVTGAVTLDGNAAPPSDPRGSLLFASDAGTVTVDLPDAGAATYTARLFAGDYDVAFTRSAACDPGKLPCGTQLLEQGVPLLVSGALNLDVASSALVTVSGTVTVNGSAPASGNRGRIEFRYGNINAGADLPTSGAATFTVQLEPRKYDVHIVPPDACTQSSPLPCEEYVWKRDVALTASGSLAVDLPVVHLSGAVTMNGQRLPDSTGSRGSVAINGGYAAGPSVSLGATGAGAYAVNIYAGSREIDVVPPSPCTPGPLPCASHYVAQLPVTVNGVYDFDLHVLQVSGHVTENGVMPPAAVHGTSRGQLVFQPMAVVAGNSVKVDLGQSGAATYSALIYAGTQVVQLENSGDCPDGAFPCGTLGIDQRDIEVSGALDYDLSVRRISLTVTANGGGIPASPSGSSRGVVSFNGETKFDVPLPPSGAATAPVTLYPANYLLYFSNDKDCPNGPMPCQKLADPAQHAITVDGPFAWDLRVLDVSGLVTANGQAVGPSVSGQARGSLLFALSAPLEPVVAAPLGTSGDARYAVRLFPGDYAIEFANSADCPASGEGALPCQTSKGLLTTSLNNPGALDVDLSVQELSGAVTLDGAQLAASAHGASRGTLRFGTRSLDLGKSGAAQYRVKLLRGSYGVRVDNPADCGGALPCGGTVVSRCP